MRGFGRKRKALAPKAALDDKPLDWTPAMAAALEQRAWRQAVADVVPEYAEAIARRAELYKRGKKF